MTGGAETTGPQRHRDTEINALTQRIIGCAIEVHRILGSGLLESVYETAMCIEMDSAGLGYTQQTDSRHTRKADCLSPPSCLDLAGC